MYFQTLAQGHLKSHLHFISEVIIMGCSDLLDTVPNRPQEIAHGIDIGKYHEEHLELLWDRAI